jgi:hypothetical protein
MGIQNVRPSAMTPRTEAASTSMPSPAVALLPRANTGRRHASTLARACSRVAFLGSLSALSGLLACGDIPLEDSTYPPQGVMEGTLVYTGPLPCVQRNHVLGTAVLLVFNENLLPPPEGFGATASQLGAIAGDVLFEGITEQLPGNPTDAVVCPPPGSPPVTVSAKWTIGPLPAGRWQIRAFYDYDGDFSPILKLHQLPTAGDIGGGAIGNVTDVLLGKAPQYQSIEVGVRDAANKLTMPPSGAKVSGISVTLGLPLALPRPLFHLQEVKDERPASLADSGKPEVALPVTLNTDPNAVVVPQDERFLLSPTTNISQADKQFIRLVLGAGIPGGNCDVEPTSERCLAVSPPYLLQAVAPYDKLYLYGDVDEQGNIKATPEKTPIPIPNLFPQAIFARLDPSDPKLQTPQASPAVIIQGLVLNEGSALKTTKATFFTADNKPLPPRVTDTVTVALRPSVICLNPLDPDATVYVVTPSVTALNGEVIIDREDIIPKVRKQLGNRPNIEVLEGCLPLGQFQTNLVYGTGQAWTMPNEAGTCIPPFEPETSAGSGLCRAGSFSRRVLPSQQGTIAIGAEREVGFCARQFSDPTIYKDGVPRVCLRADEGGVLPAPPVK